MNIDNILGKVIGTKHSREEQEALQEWQKDAEENIKALEDIKKIAALSNTMQGYESFDKDDGWAAFESSMNEAEPAPDRNLQPEPLPQIESKESPNNTPIFSIRNLTKIAAVLVVVFGSLFIIQNGIGNLAADVTEYATDASQLDIDMKDGTEILLDASSSLEILADRSVSMKGRAYFEVAKSEGSQFTIDLPVGKVTVLGTEFSIDAGNDVTTVYVHEGSVSYTLDGRPAVVLGAGDYIEVKNNDITKVKKDDDNMVSWKNRKLIFRDSNLVEVIEALSRHFKEEIIIENKENLEKCGVTNTFVNATLEDILNEFNTIYGIKYEIREKKVYIVDSNCK